MNIDFNIDNYLRLSIPDILLTILSALILVLIARHYFWNKLKDYLAKRQDFVNKSLQDAKEARQEAHKLQDEMNRQLQDLHLQGEEIISKARAEADYQADKILEEARQQAVFIQERAMEDIERERVQAADAMREAISETALAAASSILQNSVQREDHQKLIDQFIEESEAL